MGTHPIFESDFDCLTEMSQEPGKSEESRKRKRERDPNQIRVNTSNSQVKWWMVKVPKYLGEKWLSSPQSEVGKLQIRRLGARPEVTFKLNQNLAAMGENQAPIDHKLMLSVPSKSETLGILSRFTNDEDVEVRSIEGSIVQNAVCRPVAMGSRYNNLKKASFQKAERKDRKTIFMQEPVNTCLPRKTAYTIDHVANRKKAEQGKRTEWMKISSKAIFSSFSRNISIIH